MTKEMWMLHAVGAYVLLFMGVAVGLVIWKAKRRGGRLPVDFKLLRGPGESLRRRMAKFDEDFSQNMVLASLVPLLLTGFALSQLAGWKPTTWTEFWVWLGIAAAVFIASLVLAMRWALRGLIRYRSDRLGYLGEREVAERLQPLWAKGYYVFHDIPAEGRNADFNLDHVSVGPTGVAVIETKTRRKGRPRADGSEYKVVSNGETLRWPWGPESETLRQVIAQAD